MALGLENPTQIVLLDDLLARRVAQAERCETHSQRGRWERGNKSLT
jgi:hypothetical protein